MEKYGELRVFAGNSNPELARRIVEELGGTLGDLEVGRFSDGEVAVKINDNVRGTDVFLVQSTCAPCNDNLMELLIMIDACRRGSARRITAVMPYFGYARQDKKSRGREPISAKLVANLITAAGASRVLSIDLHTDQIQGFFDIPVDHLFARQILSDHFLSEGLGGDDVVVVSPDVNAVNAAMALADDLHSSLAIVAKRRPRPNVAQVVEIIGDLKGKVAIMLDDMIDTAGTMVEGARGLLERGAREVHVAATHGIFSGPAIARLGASDDIKTVVVTDTIPVPPEKHLDKMRVLSVGPLLASTLDHIHRDESVSVLLANRREPRH
ncbi:MAG TPA: ribose-phosphate pyrophosphokinase [Armatimonadota bacterium]|jgi:ribose-phosphate pyrophosphokinase